MWPTPERLFRLLSDPTRLQCMLLLRRADSLCVCELTAELQMIQPKVSRHLATLREAGLVQDERRGQWVHYRIAPGMPPWIERVLDAALEARTGGEDSARHPSAEATALQGRNLRGGT